MKLATLPGRDCHSSASQKQCCTRCFQEPICQETRAFVAQRKEEQAPVRSARESSAVSVVLLSSTSQAITAWRKKSREVQRSDLMRPCLLLIQGSRPVWRLPHRRVLRASAEANLQ